MWKVLAAPSRRLWLATMATLAVPDETVHVRRMRRRDLLIRLGLLGAGVGGAWWFRDYVLWREPEVVLPAQGSTGWLPYAEPRAPTPTVAATVNGTRVRALIDSGAQYSVIDRSLFAALGVTEVFTLPMVAYGVGGDAQVGRGTTLDVAVGGLRLDGLRAAILGLGPLAGPQGLAAPLILGQDVLRRLVLELNTPERRLRLSGREGWSPPAEVRPIPVTRSGRALQAAITVEGVEVQAVVDTGASAILALTRETARAAGLFDGRERRSGQSIVLGGVVRAETVVARTLTIGDDLYRQAEVAIYDDVPAPGFPKALIGMEAFDGRRVALDLGGPRLFASSPMDITVGGPKGR
jgi:predicted aspartyl protease